MARERARFAPPEPRRPSALKLWLRRRRALLRPAGLTLIGAAALGGVALAVIAVDPAGRLSRLADGASGLAREAGLVVQEVRFEGHRHTPPELLRAALGVRPGDPLLAFSPEAARERLLSVPWVENAHVERRLPGTILVRLAERAPFAIWQHRGQFVIVDRMGNSVTAERLDAFGPLPLIVGAGAERRAAQLWDEMGTTPELRRRVQAMVRINDRRWNLRLFNGTDVMLPEGQEAAAVRRLEELQASHALLDRPLAAIDLRLPDRMVLRQPPPPAQPAPPNATPARGSTRG
jgi:cell division protein FtsQ